MPIRGGVTLFHIKGIRISVDWSWFLVLFLIVIWLSGFYEDVLGGAQDSTTAYGLAVASALLFFGSILLHELGHAVVAIRNGIGIPDITLWMFGGVARMDRDSDSPSTEFKVAVAGPVVTALIVLTCAGVGIALTGASDFADAALTDKATNASGVEAMIAWLASINLLVLLFNLIPAFPLDGGRIARAIAWWRTGNRTSATRFAATLGRGFAYLLMGLGAVMLVQGDPVGGLWLAVIGFILNGSARGAIAQSEVTGRIEGLSVADVMDHEPVAIPETTTVEGALDDYFLRYGWPWFPVTDAAQRFIGLVDRGTADEVPAMERHQQTISQVVARGAEALTVRTDAPLEAVLGNQALARLGALIAVDDEGKLQGVITAQAVGRALRDRVRGESQPG